MESEAARLDELVATAVALQDFYEIDRLRIIECPGVPRTVASVLDSFTDMRLNLDSEPWPTAAWVMLG